MVTKILNFDSKFAITRFIQEVCATRKGALASQFSRWQDVNERMNQPTNRPTNKQTSTRTNKHDRSQYLRQEVINVQTTPVSPSPMRSCSSLLLWSGQSVSPRSNTFYHVWCISQCYPSPSATSSLYVIKAKYRVCPASSVS